MMVVSCDKNEEPEEIILDDIRYNDPTWIVTKSDPSSDMSSLLPTDAVVKITKDNMTINGVTYPFKAYVYDKDPGLYFELNNTIKGGIMPSYHNKYSIDQFEMRSYKDGSAVTLRAEYFINKTFE
ncbi:MAG: hypothetical protein MJZ16_01820 [Bacteroidales bacterium]|nr:hypothetical protein [Bacteroidales bacterium]